MTTEKVTEIWDTKKVNWKIKGDIEDQKEGIQSMKN